MFILQQKQNDSFIYELSVLYLYQSIQQKEY